MPTEFQHALLGQNVQFTTGLCSQSQVPYMLVAAILGTFCYGYEPDDKLNL